MTQANEKPGLIFQQISKVMADIKFISKDKLNTQQGFKFRGIDDVYNHVQQILAKHCVFTVSEIIARNREQVTTKSGTRAYHCVNSYKFKFYTTDGSYVEAYADGEAMDMGDKASNKCAAIAHKYVLLQTFCIPTVDMSDGDDESFEVMPKQKTLANPNVIDGVSQKQINRLMVLLKNAGMRQEEGVMLAKQMFGVDQLVNLNQGQYENICSRIEKTPKRGQETVNQMNTQFGL